jgi:septal ring factor EnvC (AmiA/AmiB activator)
MEFIILAVIMAGFALLYLKKPNLNIDHNNSRIIELEKNLSFKESSIKELEKERDILNVQIKSFDELKTKTTELETILRSISDERNDLKNKNVKLNNEEEKKNFRFKKRN